MSEGEKTYSILLRVRRTIHEDAYISVPVTTAIMKQNEDGSFALDPEALVVEAAKLAASADVPWATEATTIEPHPIQQPMPEGRTCFQGTSENPSVVLPSR